MRFHERYKSVSSKERANVQIHQEIESNEKEWAEEENLKQWLYLLQEELLFKPYEEVIFK